MACFLVKVVNDKKHLDITIDGKTRMKENMQLNDARAVSPTDEEIQILPTPTGKRRNFMLI